MFLTPNLLLMPYIIKFAFFLRERTILILALYEAMSLRMLLAASLDIAALAFILQQYPTLS